MRCTSSAARRVLQRERTDTDEAVRLLRAPFRDPVVVDLARGDREVLVEDAAELQAEPGIHDRHVDAFRVEHLHALVRVEAGGVQVLVVTALAELDEVLTGVAEADQPAIGRHAVLDEALVVAGLLVPAEADALLPQRLRQPTRPQIGRFADVTVGVDHEVLCHVSQRDRAA